MLTLMPLSGLQSALRRKNSKNYDFSRRGSLSVYSTYSLPTSKNSLRRFSSYEGLAPIFQQFLAQQHNQQQELSDGGSVEMTYSPVPSPSPSPPPPPPPPEKRKRRGSLSLGKRLRKLSGVGLGLLGDSSSQAEESSNGRKCSVDDLDNLFAKIREQLTQLKNEGTEICQRVDDLHSSVGDLYRERQVDQQHDHHHGNSGDSSGSDVLTSSCESPSTRSPPADSTHCRRQSTTMPSNLSSGSLTVIRESSFELLDDELENDSSSDDEQSFEDYCRTNIPKLGTTRAAAVRQPIRFTALDNVDLPIEHNDPKRYCLPNNLDVRPKSESAPQLEVIRNDLSDSNSTSTSSGSSQRWSVISTQSDSVLITSKGSAYRSAHQPFEL